MAQVTVTNSPVSGGPVDVSFSGFSPYGEVEVYVLETGTCAFFAVDANGNGSGSFVDSDPAGSYTLEAMDGYYDGTTSFTLGSSYQPAPALKVTNSPVQGGAVDFSFSGFYPGESVWVGVVGGGGIFKTADSSGNGAGSFTDYDPPGVYTLEASDSSGWYALAPFTLGGSQVQQPTINNFNIASLAKA